jgi:hypothetical protein
MRNMRIFILLFLLCTSPFLVAAQFDANSLLAPSLSLELQPTYPSPGETITVTLNDYQGGNFGSEIDWFLDDKSIPDAHNQRRATIVAGSVGTRSEIKVILTSPNGGVDQISASIKPYYLDVIVEPQTHVPDFYQGRALPSIGSSVNLTALLSDGTPLNTDYVYTWRVGEEVLEGGPIRGRNQTSFTTPQGREIVVSLQVTEPDGTVVAKQDFIVPSVSPQIHFYEINTLYGVGYKSVDDSFSLIGESATIKAEPYYLDSRIFNNPDIAKWSINGTDTQSFDKNPYEITFERTTFSGIADLGFHVRSMEVLLQGARNGMEVNF